MHNHIEKITHIMVSVPLMLNPKIVIEQHKTPGM